MLAEADARTDSLGRARAYRPTRPRDGVIRFGLHRQTEAVPTFIVPSPLKRLHIHLLDDDGGCAFAVRQLRGG